MTGLEWALATVTVCVAAALQAATGAGLGLIVAPVLILILHSSAAVHVAILLNLLISVLMLPRELSAVNWSLVRWLCLGTALGVPLGVWTLNRVAIDTLELVAGACVTFAALQLALVRARRRRTDAAGPAWSVSSASAAGAVSGWMTGALAMPGPATMWQLAHSAIGASSARACLRAQFVVAYSLSLATHAWGGIDTSIVAWTTIVLLPALGVGMLLGAAAKRRLTERALAGALLALLLAMGVSLLVKSLYALFAVG